MSLEVMRPSLKPGERLKASCLIPASAGVDFVGVVRWVRPAEGGGAAYAAGVEFLDPPGQPFLDLLSREACAQHKRRRALITPE